MKKHGSNKECNRAQPLFWCQVARKEEPGPCSEAMEVLLVVLRNYIGSIPKLNECFTSGFS